ncbi:MAG: hypothetical protein H5T85_04830 [Actinobacteria bacterium]|nr:hypothetical protein [Actinomycetota bacterium]
MNMRKQKNLLEYLLEKERVIVPSAIFKIEIVQELERRLSTGRPYLLYQFYNELAEELKNSIDIKKLKSMFEFSRTFKEEHGNMLTENDKRIIYFLVNNSDMRAGDFMEMLGPLYYILSITRDLKNERINSKSLKMFILTSAYVQIYELLLYQLDRRIYNYLKRLEELRKDKIFKDFMKLKRTHLQHAQAWQINKVLSKLLGINEKNDSIIGAGVPKIIRNSVSHATLFYDPGEDMIFVGSKKFSVNQFLEEYYRLIAFCLEWLDVSANIEPGDDPFDQIIVQLSKSFREIAKVFLRIERSEYKKIFGAMVIQWKKEIEDK